MVPRARLSLYPFLSWPTPPTLRHPVQSSSATAKITKKSRSCTARPHKHEHAAMGKAPQARRMAKAADHPVPVRSIAGACVGGTPRGRSSTGGAVHFSSGPGPPRHGQVGGGMPELRCTGAGLGGHLVCACALVCLQRAFRRARLCCVLQGSPCACRTMALPPRPPRPSNPLSPSPPSHHARWVVQPSGWAWAGGSGGGGGGGAGMHWKWGRYPPGPAPGRPAYAQPLCP